MKIIFENWRHFKEEDKSSLLKEQTEFKNIVLDVVGLVPGVGEVADFANAVDYAIKGDYLFSALSLISVIDIIGDAIGKGGKVGVWISKNFPKTASAIVKYGPEVRKLKEAVTKARPMVDALLTKLEENEKIGEYIPKIKEALNAFMGGEGATVAGGSEGDLPSQIQGLYDQWQPTTPEGQEYKDDLGTLLGHEAEDTNNKEIYA